MKIIQRHYLKEFSKLYLIVVLGLSFTFSLVDLMNKINDFGPGRPSFDSLLLYAGLSLPQYLVYLMPMAALISGLFVFGQAGRRKETTAIKASGGSIRALLMPFVFSGIVLSLAGFLLSEFVVPDFSGRAHKLRDSLAGKQNILSFKEGTVWLKAKGAIVKIGLFLPDKSVIKEVSIMKMNEYMLTERIEAESADWRPLPGSPDASFSAGETGATRGGTWYLTGVTDYDIDAGTVTHYRELRTDSIEPPEVFREDMQKPDEMNVRELAAYTKRLKKAGFKNTKLIVDIHSRISYPLINAIMLVLGIALATSGASGSGLITAAIGIFISLLYWVGYTACLSMGYAGIFPPIVAAWSMPALFGSITLYLFGRIPE
ncbi:MAG: LptF/LptG family permease [Nitrospirae bacterium]|nr:LptF/LptG family permease [Nitrospirota bacterium]